MKNRVICISLAVMLALSIGLIGCEQSSVDVDAVVSECAGNLSVMKEGNSSWVEAEVGTVLDPTDIIKCGNNSTARITFLNGSTVELDAGTEFKIAELIISTDTDSAIIRLNLIIGSIIFRVTNIIDPASRYEVETPAGSVAVRGSAVQITVSEDGTTWACNLEGDIWAIAQGVELQIPEGECCIIRPGQPPELLTAAYSLSVSSTAGGSVAVPGEGTFPYNEGTVVDLVADVERGHQFDSWTGDVDTVVNVNAASTTITMQGNYSVTANFAPVEVTFADPNLEAAVRDAIAKPVGPIYTLELEGLTLLDAGERNIANLAGLEYCTNLTELRLWKNQIGDISPLASLFSLTSLDLRFNQINDLSPLASLAHLDYLLIGWNPITDISALGSLTNLTYLEIWSTQVSNISPLAHLTNLSFLGLGGNKISDFSPLASLTSLTDANFYDSQMGDISPLANLVNLTRLFLQSNQISDISPLASLTNLASLRLWDNQISDISPLTNLTNLTWLDLKENQITDISPLVENEGMGTGDKVYLTGNPLSSDSINIYIPQLQARGVIVDYLRLLSPAPGSTAVPITDIDFTWTGATLADAFDWVLSKNADLSSPVDSKTGLVSTVWTYNGTLDYVTTYHWQVKAYLRGTAIGSSAIGSFTTITPAP